MLRRPDTKPRRAPDWTRRTMVAAAVVAVAFGWRVGEGAAPIAADKATTAANITRVVTSLLAGSQFAHHPLDDQLAGKLLERYLEALDGSRSLFLQTDVDELATYRRTLAYATRVEGDTRPAQTIFKRFLERLGQQAAYDTELLRSAAFDFTGRDTFLFDRDRAARPRDLTSAHAIWREELRAEVLQEKLGDKKPPAAEIAKTLTRRHAQQLRMMTALGRGRGPRDLPRLPDARLRSALGLPRPRGDGIAVDRDESVAVRDRRVAEQRRRRLHRARARARQPRREERPPQAG